MVSHSQRYTPVDKFPQILAELKETFASGRTKAIPWRQRQLLQLARLAQENAEALAKAVYHDMGKPRLEVYMAEIGPIVERSVICAQKVAEWAKDEDKTSEVEEWAKGWQPRVRKEPKGVALIIGPWNYPVILSLQPLYGAIAAGCCAVIKTSEIAPHYSALLAELVPKYLDADAYRVVQGAVPEVTRLLELKWDHIFYTGNSHVARIISGAAAKHLTTVTLELGGKSPVLIDSNADVDLAAKRIIWGKSQNAGQLCVTPDYVLCPRSVLEKFITAIHKHASDFWPDGSLKSPSFSRIVSDVHFSRLSSYLKNTSARVVYGGSKDYDGIVDPEGRKRGIEMTAFILEKEHWEDDVLLSCELFGPLLPILPVEDIDEAISFLSVRDHPLVLYAFTQDEEVKRKILHKTTSGGVVFNDTFQQMAINEIPFGGTGESGNAKQVLKYSFDLFSYERAVIDVSKESEPFLSVRYPPYNDEKFSILSGPTLTKIPNLEDL